MSETNEATPGALYARNRREELTAQKMCINGAHHGPATCGVLCRWCREVHRRGVTAVIEDPSGPVPPPGYKFRQRRFEPTLRATE